MMMKSTALLVLSFAVLTGCGRQTPSALPTVIEAEPPAVGADGKLAQSIGIETLDGVFTPLFSQGTAKLVVDCDHLGQFQVVGITPAPRGTPQIEITFAVQEGNVLFSAKDLSTEKPMEIKKTESSQPMVGGDG